MESILDSINSSLDESISRFKRLNGRDFTNLIITGQQTNDIIREGLKEISAKHDSDILKIESILEKTFEWSQLSIKTIDKFEESDDMRELKTFCNGDITLTNKEMTVIKTITLQKKSEIMKPILQIIEDISKLQNSLKQMESEIKENNELIGDSFSKIENIRQRYNQVMECQNKEKEINLKEEQKRENELRERELRENELREKELREKELREKELREQELREKEFVEEEKWKKFKYPLVSENFPDSTLICIIHAYRGTLISENDISVKACQSEEMYSCLKIDDEIISSVVRIKPFNMNSSFNLKVPWRISIPYSIITDMRKEVSIFCKDKISDKFSELDTQDTIYEESGVEGVKFAECALPSPNCCCVVISKRKAERFNISKDGMQYESKGDEKVLLKILPASLMINLSMKFVIQSIKTESLNEIKSQSLDSFGIQSMSPIVELIAEMNKKLLKPMELQLPISNATANASRKKRLNSANPVSQKNTYNRPKTSYNRKISDEQKATIKLASYNDDANMWEVENELKMTFTENYDLLTAYITHLGKHKLVAVRCSEDVDDEQILKELEQIEQYSRRRSVVFGIGQSYDDPFKLTFFIVSPNKIDKIKKSCDFNEETLSISQAFDVYERDRFKINLNGNIIPVEDSEIMLRYNSCLSNRVEFHIRPKDIYAQKNLESHQGYILVYKEEEMSAENYLYKTSINLPKYEYRRDITMNLDFKFKSTDVIDNDYLKFLSSKIGNCWKSLGRHLQLQEETIRRIENDPKVDVDSKPYACLLNWIKNSTVQTKRAQQMKEALRSVGRNDLVNDLLVRSKKQ